MTGDGGRKRFSNKIKKQTRKLWMSIKSTSYLLLRTQCYCFCRKEKLCHVILLMKSRGKGIKRSSCVNGRCCRADTTQACRGIVVAIVPLQTGIFWRHLRRHPHGSTGRMARTRTWNRRPELREKGYHTTYYIIKPRRSQLWFIGSGRSPFC